MTEGPDLWSDAGEEVSPAVDCAHVSLDAPVWCGVYKAVSMLCHIYTALCRMLSAKAQAVCYEAALALLEGQPLCTWKASHVHLCVRRALPARLTACKACLPVCQPLMMRMMEGIKEEMELTLGRALRGTPGDWGGSFEATCWMAVH